MGQSDFSKSNHGLFNLSKPFLKDRNSLHRDIHTLPYQLVRPVQRSVES